MAFSFIIFRIERRDRFAGRREIHHVGFFRPNLYSLNEMVSPLSILYRVVFQYYKIKNLEGAL